VRRGALFFTKTCCQGIPKKGSRKDAEGRNAKDAKKQERKK